MARGSEAYLQMWERADGIPTGCRPARARLTRHGVGGRPARRGPRLAAAARRPAQGPRRARLALLRRRGADDGGPDAGRPRRARGEHEPGAQGARGSDGDEGEASEGGDEGVRARGACARPLRLRRPWRAGAVCGGGDAVCSPEPQGAAAVSAARSSPVARGERQLRLGREWVSRPRSVSAGCGHLG